MKTKGTMNHFIITTTTGTRWAETATSEDAARRNFFGNKIGIKIKSVEAGRLFTDEEEEQLDRDKAIERCR